MTQDDIVVMAVNAGLVKWEVLAYKNELERFAKLVAAKEREACLKIQEECQYSYGNDLAKAIRARGEA